ncbi:murein L,D-transpeptidase catalytic domain family protein [Sphingosinicella rhizophila]|uniref:Murein L,D-transpeptidase catalytic domain family protein n=1 Tax=Sphingosinicella rhizophila TaxID=3050082 RepID=A0ABU3Q4E4_9SPHN|nr:murein L,D-transpeptidase catalytic domain family protein [Sphingosinicella sp. GR2756]MDT9598271.1 murein L,D-transpeptidase catalytic domain family protein [Sphingosinicella sp. GR2756]
MQAGAAGLVACAARPALGAAAIVAPVQPKINPRLMERAKAALESKRGQIRDGDVIAITDFSQASRFDRFYLVDMIGGMVTSYQVAHGRGSDPAHSGYLEHFSNVVGSEATSAGAYVTENVYYGKYGRSLRLRGLDHSNSNAEARAIVVHAAKYAEPDMVDHFGKLGRSEGCFALSQISLQYVLQRLGPGRMIYADKV